MNAGIVICEPSPAVPATTWWEYLRKQVQELNSTGPAKESPALAQSRQIDAIRSLTFRWGALDARSAQYALRELENWKVSV